MKHKENQLGKELLNKAINLPIIAQLLSSIELRTNIRPIARYISSLAILSRDTEDGFDFTYRIRGKNQRDINIFTRNVYSIFNLSSGFRLEIDMEPIPKRQRKASKPGFFLSFERNKPVDFIIEQKKDQPVVLIKNGKLTKVGNIEPMTTMLLYKFFLKETERRLKADLKDKPIRNPIYAEMARASS